MAQNLFTYIRMWEEEHFVECFSDLEQLEADHEPRHFPDDVHASNAWGSCRRARTSASTPNPVRAEREQRHACRTSRWRDRRLGRAGRRARRARPLRHRLGVAAGDAALAAIAAVNVAGSFALGVLTGVEWWTAERARPWAPASSGASRRTRRSRCKPC
jgi:hypothetical protein